MMITDGSRTQDTILVHLYSLIGVSSLNVLELSEDLREGGLDVTDKEVKQEVEVLCRKGLLSFTSDYIEDSTYSAQDDPLWVTSVGCSAAEAVMSRIADTDGEVKQRAIAAAMAANKRLEEQEKGNK